VNIVDTIRVVFDIGTEKATSAVKGLTGEVKGADGALGKAKAAVGGLGSALTASPALLASAGAAVGAFALHAISKFEDTALAAGKLSDATGVTTQEAGQLIEVFGDIGVSSDSVEGGLNKMNKALGTNRAAFEDLHLVGKTTGETFTNVIQYLHGISDPAERAAQGTKLLGKSWTDLAEVIAAGGPALTKAMADVSTHKAVTPEQVAQARELRDALDKLSDAGEELTLTLGATLLPAVTGLAEGVGALSDGLDQVLGPIGGLGTALSYVTLPVQALGAGMKAFADVTHGDFVGAIGDATGPLRDLGSHLPVIGGLFHSGADAAKKHADALRDNAVAVGNQFGDWDELAASVTAATDAQKENTKATEAATAAAQAQSDAILGEADAVLGSKSAEAAYAKVLGDGNATMADRVAAAGKVAKAHVAQAQQMADATGQTLSADEKTQILISSLQALAAQADGPTSAAIADLVAQLHAVPGNTTATVSVSTIAAQKAIDDLINKYHDLAHAEVAGAFGGPVYIGAGASSTGSTPAGPAVVVNVRTGIAGNDYAVGRAVARQVTAAQRFTRRR